MSKRASPTLVGAFVIAGVALTVAGILAFAGGRFFRDTASVIVYFDGSVSGLRVGAPVKFRGIEIGNVKTVRINISGAIRDPRNVRIPVVLELDLDALSEQGVTQIDLRDAAQVQRLVDLGLRAQLATESVVTGRRYVALDVKPDTPAVLVKDPLVTYPEIPSVRGQLSEASEKVDKILGKLADVDVEKIADSVQATVDDVHELLSSASLKRAVDGLDDLTANMNRTVTELEKTARLLAPIVTSAHRMVTSADRMVAPDGTLSSQVDRTLKELADAARSMRRLADQLSRDPGSIVRGGRQ